MLKLLNTMFTEYPFHEVKLKPNKNIIKRKELTWLGYSIDGFGITPEYDRAENIKITVHPKTMVARVDSDHVRGCSGYHGQPQMVRSTDPRLGECFSFLYLTRLTAFRVSFGAGQSVVTRVDSAHVQGHPGYHDQPQVMRSTNLKVREHFLFR